jgi:protein tyrosine/serine phosphatase
MQKIKITILCSLILLISGCAWTNRPSTWAQPMPLKHLNNFYKVDNNLYRSAQPDLDGILQAKDLGIKTIIDLQSAPHEDPVPFANEDLKFERIPQYASCITDENVSKFLNIVSHKENGPFLVHCLHGSDRTGAAVAMYRITQQNWTKDDAITEMIHGGYGFHFMFINIPEYIEDVDVNKIKNSIKK